MALCTRLSKLSKKTRIIFKILLSIILVFLIFIIFLRFSPYGNLNRFINNRQYSTRIYDCNNNLIQILPLENGLRREFTSLEKIPKKIQESIITAEDKRFYKHSGVDFSAIFRAMFQNAAEKETVSGASTITMQLARIISPRPKRTIFAKISEAINAWRLELRLSKSQILELYLNNLPFGFNSEGITTAGRTFYGKSLYQLTENEIYTLAVIPRRPSTYNPITNPEKSSEIAGIVFNKDKEEILKDAKKAHSFIYELNMPHYINYLKHQENIHCFGKDDITLSVNLKTQILIQELLEDYLNHYSENRITNGAVLVINTQTGEIIAWAGSGNFFNNYAKGQIDGVLAKNQPGSSMKPFLYALALDSGYSPGTVLPDIPTDFGFEELYVPQNFNNRFNGPVRLRVALASSLNVPGVYLLNHLGLKNYINKLIDIGFTSLENQTPGLGLALGNAEVSIFELVQGFSIFPRDGRFIPLSFTPEDSVDKKINNSKQVFSQDCARIICDILSDKGARSTGFRNTKAFDTPFPSIFKTGTANQYQNITALAGTPKYTVGVWMGNFDGETVMGKTGSSIPASIAKTVLESLQEEYIDFNPPVHWKKAKICSTSGLIAGKYCPHSVLEYVRDDEMNICTWHSENGTEYPQIYNNWLNQKNREGIISEKSEKLSILSPKNNSVFFYDDNFGEKQKLYFELTAPVNKPIFITVKNNISGKTDNLQILNKLEFTIPMERGNFTLTLNCENQSTAINYIVH